MSLNEYHQASHGFLMRKQKDQVPFRKIYQILYNANSKHPVYGAAISKHWPLDMLDGITVDNIEEMKERFKRAQEANRQRKLLQQKAAS